MAAGTTNQETAPSTIQAAEVMLADGVDLLSLQARFMGLWARVCSLERKVLELEDHLRLVADTDADTEAGDLDNNTNAVAGI
jgi:hypothetical protein